MCVCVCAMWDSPQYYDRYTGQQQPGDGQGHGYDCQNVSCALC